ncbi:MAG: UDP-N-acetylmuramate:L-alanyl-gamma-D-glutamyl-meso-diaminopimelate ligase [Pseudomonadota bacterium]|nr:UDP-N-acetylmuramate:L-alanyl-gamma-D-glutamyl-meso-diaminopimelate ligase [Pseudomonadota bacterium]
MLIGALKKNAHIHMMGICGTAMASLAGILRDMGYKVSGSDENIYPPMSTQLKELGINIKLGYKPENLDPKPDLVIVGNVITKKNPEAIKLEEMKIPFKSLPEMIGELVINDRESYVVAGTHGKTTATALLAWLADKCGYKPGFLIGGIPKNFPHSFRKPEGTVFVIEGDEYDTAFFAKVPKFIYYKPRFVILTSVEFDHADIYNSLDDVMKAFQQLLDKIPNEGLLVYHADDQNIKKLLKTGRAVKSISYGRTEGDYRLGKVVQTDNYTEFEVLQHGVLADRIKIPMFGEYNLLNALGCYAMARERKWNLKKAVEAMATFEGVKRRQEVLGSPNDITVIEDFAHHPTAVKVTVEAVQKKYPTKKVISVFEPRSATSRRKMFEKDYVDAFSSSHEVVLSEPYNQTNIIETDRLSSDRIVEALSVKGVKSKKFSDVDAIVTHLKLGAKPGDVILIMSNGAFGGIYQKLLNVL